MSHQIDFIIGISCLVILTFVCMLKETPPSKAEGCNNLYKQCIVTHSVNWCKALDNSCMDVYKAIGTPH